MVLTYRDLSRSGASPICVFFVLSGPQKGPAERSHVKNRQKVSKTFSTLFDVFRAGQKTRERGNRALVPSTPKCLQYKKILARN